MSGPDAPPQDIPRSSATSVWAGCKKVRPYPRCGTVQIQMRKQTGPPRAVIPGSPDLSAGDGVKAAECSEVGVLHALDLRYQAK